MCFDDIVLNVTLSPLTSAFADRETSQSIFTGLHRMHRYVANMLETKPALFRLLHYLLVFSGLATWRLLSRLVPYPCAKGPR